MGDGRGGPFVHAIYEGHGSDWSRQVSTMGTTQWLQHDQTFPLSAKGVACDTIKLSSGLGQGTDYGSLICY